jgi:large subunit ribosomal protein L29
VKANELRELSVDDLKAKISSLSDNCFRLRCNNAVGQLTDTSALKEARRDVARAKTLLGQKLRNN